MRFDLGHFRTKLGLRIVLLFVGCAVVPTVLLSLRALWEVRTKLREQSGEQMELATGDAQMGAIDRFQSVEGELILHAASPIVAQAASGAADVTGGITTMRRLGALTFVTSDAAVQIAGDLTDTPELSPEDLAVLDAGESVVALVRGTGIRPEILMARVPDGASSDDGILWGRAIADSLWMSAQVYAIGIAATEIDFQDAKGYCVLDENDRPLDCAGALVTWFAQGVPDDVQIHEEGVFHGPLEWTSGAVTYQGYYRRLFLGDFNSGDWTIVLGEDQETIFESVAEFQNWLVGFVVLVTASVLLLAAISIRSTLEPLAKLREGTRRVAAQDFSARVQISSGNEFEELAGSFNEMASQVGTLVSELRDLNWSTITTLARTIDAKSSWTAGHSERVSQMAVAIARTMGLSDDELERLYRGGLLHDIGKIGIPATIIDKKGKLTDEEYAMMKSHVTIGARILEPLSALADVIPIVLYHHERWDGRGYEAQLAGEEIPQLARILCVADTYDAIRSDRPYRAGRSPDETLEEIAMCSGSQFDAEAVEAFVEYMASEEGELASMGRFTTPFGLPGIEGGESSRKLVTAEPVGV